MSKVITIDGVEYPGFVEEEPNGIEIDTKKLDKYTKIFEENYCHIQKGTPVMYYKNKKLVNFGKVVKFINPDIFVLKNESLFLIWSVGLSDTDVYVQDLKEIQKENTLKENLLELYKAGYIKILDEPIQEE
jgi:hypothetical protein